MQPLPSRLVGWSRQSSLLTIVSKSIETIMQLRVDVKKEQADRFREVLREVRQPTRSKQETATSFFSELIPKDLYNVVGRLQPHPTSSNYPVLIEFSLLNKKTQVRETVECWQLKFTLNETVLPPEGHSMGSSELR